MIGFNGLIDQIKQSIKSGNISHAHLVIGPDGIGKSVFARKFATLLINQGEDRERENYVDITEVRTDKASIGVDEIRKTVSEANVKPFEGDVKVIIIYESDKMTVQAQNALLKTLEEPPSGVYFILISEFIDGLLPTIKSRVQTHRLPMLSENDMLIYLDNKYKLSEKEKEEMVALSQGIPGSADSFLTDESSRIFYSQVFSFMEILSNVRGLRDLNMVKVLEQNKLITAAGTEKFFTTIILICRDLMILKLSNDYKKLIFLYNKEVLEKNSQKFSLKRLNQIINVSEKALDLLRPGRNINKETVTDYILFKLLEEV